MTPRPHELHIRISPTDKHRLEALRDHTGQTNGTLIREAIEALWMMHIQQAPICAIGTPCLCPSSWMNHPINRARAQTQEAPQ